MFIVTCHLVLSGLSAKEEKGDRRHLAYARCPSDEVALSVSSSDDCCCCNWQCDGWNHENSSPGGWG